MENEDLARQRAEIEKRLLQRVKEVQGLVDSSMPGFPTEDTPGETPVESPLSRVEESALARIKREREEKKMAVTPTGDTEMMSVGGRTDGDEVAAPVLEGLVSPRLCAAEAAG